MWRFAVAAVLCLFLPALAPAQSLGNTGAIEGIVKDSSGAVIPNATVSIRNPVTSFNRTTTTAADGTFRFSGVPQNPYHLEIAAQGFDPFARDVTVRSAVAVQLKATLEVAGSNTTVTVESAGAGLVETEPSAHTDVDRGQLSKLPAVDPAGGLSQAIIYSTGGVAADANGAFHPLGDHAQVSFVVDGQPISDQQSKVFSTQLPTNAIQSMELDTGAPNAEFGDKTSLVAQITTRSGLGASKPFGSLETAYGSFGTVEGSASLGFGGAKYGNFLSLDGTRSGRFLDSPEFTPFHDTGNNQTVFDRLDLMPNGVDAYHLNLFLARNWIQIPNTYDQLAQDQRQRVLTWSFAPGYQHTFGSHALLTVNPYVRKDEFSYYGSRDPLLDTPATQSQARQLLNWGLRTDLAITRGRHNIKIGADLKQTRLREDFTFGITDPSLAAPPSLAPYDLASGGRLFLFHATGNIDQYAGYAQDAITAGNFLISLGLRFDRYAGLSTANAAEPRAAVSYHIKATGTVLRASFTRSLETPFNENLLLSSATGAGGLAANVFGASSLPVPPGRRNQFNTGFEQSLGRHLLLDADYFWKYTLGGYDFSTLLNTTITFPVSWQKSKVDGLTGRLSTANLGGFQGYWTFGSTRARYFPPEIGGLVSQGADLGSGVFRIDHDQAFQSTASFRYQPKRAEWIELTWRYDSGMVVSGVPDVAAALALSAAQQVTIGFACNGVPATYAAPITACSGLGTSRLLTLPQTGQENNDLNPDRVKARHVFNLGIGTDNLTHTEKPLRITAA
ncbi:MAG: TonB-dependent receptor, partial [Acidobacteriota bacterium]|nr:TonB-dependent receptor [Acidobacteriota bacterium]